MMVFHRHTRGPCTMVVSRCAALAPVALLSLIYGCSRAPTPEITTDSAGTVHIPALAIPLSPYMSEAAKASLMKMQQRQAESRASRDEKPTTLEQQRQALDKELAPMIKRAQALYPVTSEQRKIGGVPTEIFTP